MRIHPLLLSLSLIVCSGLCVTAEPILIGTDHPSGIYDLSEEVQWTILRDLDLKEVHYTLKDGGWTVREEGTLVFDQNQAILKTHLEEPGTVLLEVTWSNAEGESQRALGGVVCAPEKIEMSQPTPEDFDAFWAEKIAELQAIPVDAQLEKIEIATPEVDYWKISMNNIRGSKIQGQLARPQGAGPRPALLVVQWAGVYPLNQDWVTGYAADGWLVLNIQAHDIPIDEDQSFYDELKSGALNYYGGIGMEDRETSYFLRMLLSCYRAADYLSKRSDWDGETFAVMGGSQGGYQSLVTAGMHPAITVAMASVPAGCDLTGVDVGRKSGWPGYYRDLEGVQREKVRSAARYFDVGNFTPRIKCPVLVSLGLIDETCPPEGILAAINRITTPVERIILPQGPHQNVKGSHSAYGTQLNEIWLPALVDGQIPSVSSY